MNNTETNQEFNLDQLKRNNIIELALSTTTTMRSVDGSGFIQVGQFFNNNIPYNFFYDRSSKKGTYRNAVPEKGICNNNANIYFTCLHIGNRIIIETIG